MYHVHQIKTYNLGRPLRRGQSYYVGGFQLRMKNVKMQKYFSLLCVPRTFARKLFSFLSAGLDGSLKHYLRRQD
jgi:hypothetical protein